MIGDTLMSLPPLESPDPIHDRLADLDERHNEMAMASHLTEPPRPSLVDLWVTDHRDMIDALQRIKAIMDDHPLPSPHESPVTLYESLLTLLDDLDDALLYVLGPPALDTEDATLDTDDGDSD